MLSCLQWLDAIWALCNYLALGPIINLYDDLYYGQNAMDSCLITQCPDKEAFSYWSDIIVSSLIRLRMTNAESLKYGRVLQICIQAFLIGRMRKYAWIKLGH